MRNPDNQIPQKEAVNSQHETKKRKVMKFERVDLEPKTLPGVSEYIKSQLAKYKYEPPSFWMHKYKP